MGKKSFPARATIYVTAAAAAKLQADDGGNDTLVPCEHIMS